MKQYLAVKARGGGFDPRRSVLITFNSRGHIAAAERATTSVVAPIVPISRLLFHELEYTLKLKQPRKLLTLEERREVKRQRSEVYRKYVYAKRIERYGRFIDELDRGRVRKLLVAGCSGVSIAISVGVSTSYVSRMKIAMRAAGEL